jgi:hypothetical protein
MKDIAKLSKVGYTTLKSLWKEFTKRKLVVQTRTVGRAKMYKLNLQNSVVNKFVEFYWEVIYNEIDKKVENTPKESGYSQITNIGAASTKKF